MTVSYKTSKANKKLLDILEMTEETKEEEVA